MMLIFHRDLEKLSVCLHLLPRKFAFNTVKFAPKKELHKNIYIYIYLYVKDILIMQYLRLVW